MKNFLLGMMMAAGPGLLWAQPPNALVVENGASLHINTGDSLHIDGSLHILPGGILANNGMVYQTARTGSTQAFYDENTNGTLALAHFPGKLMMNGTGLSQLFVGHNRPFAQLQIHKAGADLANRVAVVSGAFAQRLVLHRGPVELQGNLVVGQAGVPEPMPIEAALSNVNFANGWLYGNGLLRLFISPAQVNAYRLPVGNSSGVRLAEIYGLQAQPISDLPYVDARFDAKDGTDAGLMVVEGGTAYTSVNDFGVWRITSTSSSSTGRYNLRLYTNAATGLADNRFAPLFRQAVSSNAADWQLPAGSSISPTNGDGRLVSQGYAVRLYTNRFGQYGIGQSAFVLPIVLGPLKARWDGPVALLSWTGAQAQAGDKMVVEHSLNGTEFSAVTTLAAKADGSAASHHYQFAHSGWKPGKNYYRIKALDVRGATQYTNTALLEKAGQDGIKLYPNPARNFLMVTAPVANEPLAYQIVDAGGRQVQAGMLSGPNTRLEIGGLAPGQYRILIPTKPAATAAFLKQ